MNDDRINKIIDYLANRVEKIESFAAEQIPDVIQQIVTMDLVTALASVTCILLVILLGLVIYIFIWKITKNQKEENKWMPRIIAAVVFVPIASVLIGVVLIPNTITALKANYAPKAYLLERVGVLKPIGGRN